MAAIGSIRKHSTILLIIVAVALLAFLLGDFSRRNRGNKFYDKFIVVGKENISYSAYMSKYDGYREMQKANNAGRNLTSEEDFRLGMQAYDELVDSVIFAKQAGYLGITVSAQELHDLIAGPQPHPMAARIFVRDGAYNMQLAQNFLDNIEQFRQKDSVFVNYYLTVLEPMIEKETFQNKYLNLLSGAYYLPKAFAQKISSEASLKADLEVLQMPYTSELVSDDKISFTQDEVKKYYEENKFRFKQDDELRNVEYVLFPIEPTEQDLKNIEEYVHKTFEEFTKSDRPDHFVNRLADSRYDSTYYKKGVLEPGIDTLLFAAPEGSFVAPYIDGGYWKFAKLLSARTRPDSINVSFIFIGWRGTEQNHRNKDESQKIADSAFRAVMSGVNFFDAAVQYSDVSPTQLPDSGRIWMIDGSDMKLFGDDQHVFDTLYSFQTGTIIKRELPHGVLIYRLNEKTAAERKIQVAIGKKLIAPSQETVNNIESAANNFVNGTDTYQKFVDAVVAHNLDKRTNDRVTKMSYTLPGIREGGREIIRWIFDENTEKGTVSNVFPLEDMYVVVVLKDIYPEGYMSLDQEQIKNYIESLVKKDKKAEKLEIFFNAQLSKLKNLTAISEQNKIELDTVTVSFADRNFGHYGAESKMIGKLFGQAAVGKIEIMKGDMGVYAVKANKINVPDPKITPTNNENLSMMMQQNKMMYQNRISNGGTQFLRKMYKIKDNRYKVM